MPADRMTVAEAAAALGVSVTAVYAAINGKRIPARRRKGEGLTLAAADVEAYRLDRDKWRKRTNQVPTTETVRIRRHPEEELGVYVRRNAGALTWRRHAAVAPGEGVEAVEVPAGWLVGTSERQSARIRTTDGDVAPLQSDQLSLFTGGAS